MLLGIPRRAAEEFSFALAVVITPPIIAREYLRALRYSIGVARHGPHRRPGDAGDGVGMVFPASAPASSLASRWLSGWLENGRWHYFGFYCFAAAAGIFASARGWADEDGANWTTSLTGSLAAGRELTADEIQLEPRATLDPTEPSRATR